MAEIILGSLAFLIIFTIVAMVLIGWMAHRERLRFHLKDGKVMLSNKDGNRHD